VLRAAQGHRTELTWQPRDGVRSAIVVLPFHGPQGTGTVMVGRSLTEVEKRETLLVELVAAGLLGGLGATAAACLLAAWLRRRPSFAG
jgi:AAA+ superfamily predicted ATPase